jgi:gliding motility-associated lipoprotein GldH
MQYLRNAMLALLGLCWLNACTTIDVFEKQQRFGSQQWSSKEPTVFRFNISDTSSSYNIFFVLRHTDAYAYQNIWVKAKLQRKGDSSAIDQKVNIPLANTDKWNGTGMDDIFEMRHQLNSQPVALRAGEYVLQIDQLMRIDPLPEILSVGLRVEKAR